MKRYRFNCTVPIIAVASFLLLANYGIAQDLLLNGGFEDGDPGVPDPCFSVHFPLGTYHPDHWASNGSAGNWYGGFWNHTPGGSRCIGTYGIYTYAYQGVNVVGDAEYAIRAYCQPVPPAWPEGVGGILEVIWFDFPDPNMDDYADRISRQTAATFVPGEFDYDVWNLVEGTITAPAEAQSALVLIGNKDGAGWTSGFWDDAAFGQLPAVPPADCAEVHSRGYGLAADLVQDCYINWADFGIFASQWLMCDDPERFDEPGCEANW